MRRNKKCNWLSLALIVVILAGILQSDLGMEKVLADSNSMEEVASSFAEIPMEQVMVTESEAGSTAEGFFPEESPQDQTDHAASHVTDLIETGLETESQLEIKESDDQLDLQNITPMSSEPVGNSIIADFSLESSNSGLQMLSGESDTVLITIKTNGDSAEVLTTPLLTVTIPSQYLEAQPSAPDISMQTAKSIQLIEGNYIIKYTLGNLTGGQWAQIPITFTTNLGYIPDGRTIAVSAVLEDNLTHDIFEANEGEPLVYIISTAVPVIQKAILVQSTYNTRDGYSAFAGIADPNDTQKLSSDRDDLTYVYFTYHVSPTYYDTVGARFAAGMKITDQVPEGAYFEAEANPGWVYNEESRVATYYLDTVSTQMISSGRAVLKVKFPGFRLGTEITNNMKFEIIPYNQEEDEQSIILEDDLKFVLNARIVSATLYKVFQGGYDDTYTRITAPNSTVNTERVRNLKMGWSLAIGNPMQMDSPVGNIVLRDYGLDDRLEYDSILIYSSYGSSQSEQPITGGGVNIYAITDGDQKVMVQSGVDASVEQQIVTIPEDLNAKEIIIETEAGAVLESGTTASFYIMARFKDPDIDPLGNGGVNTFYNRSDFSGDYKKYSVSTTVNNRSDFFILSDYAPKIYLTKTVTNKDYVEGDVINYGLQYYITGLTVGELETYEKIIDFIPIGYEYVPGAISTAEVGEPEIIHNYKGSGRTALIWSLENIVQSSEYRTTYTINYKLKVTATAVPGTNTNEAFIVWGGTDITSAVSATQSEFEDIYDFNDNGDITEIFAKSTASVVYVPAKEVIITKSVQGNLDGDFMTTPAVGSADPESSVQYKISVFNNSLTDVSNLTILDNLPKLGDTSTASDFNGNFTQRGSEFQVNLTGPVVISTGREDDFTVYYSEEQLSGNPGNYVNNASWSQSVGDYSKVTAIKIEMNSSEIIAKEETVEFLLNCITPDLRSAPEFSTATNSFAASINPAQTGFFESNHVSLAIEEQDIGIIELIIRDVDTKEPIPGAVYQLKNESGEIIGTCTSDQNGQIRVKNLISGKYSFYEIQIPAGYYTDVAPVKGEVFAGQITDLLIEKERIKGNLDITVVEKGTNQPVEGASYELINNDEGRIGIYTTDERGQITVSGLLPGEYRIFEKGIPEGYIVNNTTINITIIQNETAEVVIELIQESEKETLESNTEKETLESNTEEETLESNTEEETLESDTGEETSESNTDEETLESSTEEETSESNTDEETTVGTNATGDQAQNPKINIQKNLTGSKDSSNSPQTGDNTKIILIAGIAILAATIAVMTSVAAKNNKN